MWTVVVVQDALSRHPKNGALHLELASLYRQHHTNFIKETLCLRDAYRASRALDIKFVVYQRTRQLQVRTTGALVVEAFRKCCTF